MISSRKRPSRSPCSYHRKAHGCQFVSAGEMPAYNSFEVGKQRGLRFLIGKRFGALLSAFHDELIQCRINGEGIVAVETSKTKTVQRSAGRADHSLHVEITETVHAKIFTDVFHRHLVRD